MTDPATPLPAFEPPAERAFLDWAHEVCERLWLEPGEDRTPDDFLGFLRRAYADNGALPAELLAPLVQERRTAEAGRFLARLAGPVRRETGFDLGDILLSEPPDEFQPTGTTQIGNITVLGVRTPDIACETAEGVQDYLMSRHRTVWPQCPAHRLGYHPVLTGTAPEWECSGGGGHRVPVFADGS